MDKSHPHTQSLNDISDVIDGYVVVQPKLDGIRGIWNPEKGYIESKLGTRLNVDYLIPRFKGIEYAVDFELWSPELSFNEILSDYKSGRELEPWVFDIDTQESQIDRIKSLQDIGFKTVPHKVIDIEDVEDFYNESLSRGYEGVIIRGFKQGIHRSRNIQD